MRHNDWQNRYNRAIETAGLLPFMWGTHDCVMFAAYVTDQITDIGLLPRIHKKAVWTNEEEARAIIATGGGLEALISEFLGSAVPPLTCSKGDVMLAMNGDGKEIVTIHDGQQLITPGALGLIGLPMRVAKKGWRI